jgi:hypothetical protein
MRRALSLAWRYESQSKKTTELDRTWSTLAPSIGTRKLSIDLRNATYADANGIRILHKIHSQTAAALITGTPWTQYLAEEVTRESEPNS